MAKIMMGLPGKFA